MPPTARPSNPEPAPDEPLDTAAVVSMRGLRKSYGDVHAVRGVDLDVQPGEVFALLGPNGAGKTTLVEILVGYRHRTGGTVQVLDEDPQSAGLDWRARLGVVLQSANAFDELTVDEIVRHFAGYFPHPRSTDEIVEVVGLHDKRSVRAGKLSGGQRRRLDVALAIVGQPELVFLDEPTTGFDPEARRAFWGLIRSLADGGTTIVLTTHYLDEAEALADRVGVLVRGSLVEVGPPATLAGRQHAETEVRFLGPNGPELICTPSPTATVTMLARRFGGEVPELTVRRPSLEDVYLRMIHAGDGTADDDANGDADDHNDDADEHLAEDEHRKVVAR